MADLEAAVAGPSAAAGWLERVARGLDAVREALDSHIREVEGQSGILADITTMAPRLTAAARDLEDEHGGLLESLRRAELGLESARAAGQLEQDALRRRVTSLLGRLTLHRQHGADLVYEAYNVDIEGGD